MKKIMFCLILGVLLVGSIGMVIAEENVTCSTNEDCGEVAETISCSNETSLCTSTITPTCYEAGTNESYCEDVSEEICEDCAEGETCTEDTCVAELVCDSDNLDLCTGQNECEDAGGDWDNGVCSEEEEPEDEEERCANMNQGECDADDKCEYNAETETCERIRIMKGLKQRLIDYLGSDECPEGCVCAGSTIKCETEEGRTMTVVAGRSGNIIIQTKTINASTTVELIKNSEDGLLGNFSGKLKRIRYDPEQIREMVLKRLKMRDCSAEDCTMTLNEDGTYEMNVKRQYRILGIFPKKITEVVKIDSETGEEVQIRRPWWRFLAFKNKE